MTPPRLAITMGDPSGIGPEIVAKALGRLQPAVEAGELALVVTGSAPTHRAAAASLGLADHCRAQTEAEYLAAPAPLAFVEVDAAPRAYPPGRVSAEGGALAYAAITAAVRLATAGRVEALCTAPLSKEGLSLAGYPYAGHTELLADLTGVKDPVMMLAHGAMRVSHVTTHIALDQVAGRVTAPRIARVVALTDAVLRRLGIAAPRIAVAALNPHAGEGGLFGRQDTDVIAPAVASLKADGYDVEGPVSGDTVFVKLRGGQYHAVVAMYHDQGHIPVKLLGFSVDPATGRWQELSGVNVTLGLPIIRTSVDHGTAIDIAGQGVASEQSLLEAIGLAVRLARAGA